MKCDLDHCIPKSFSIQGAGQGLKGPQRLPNWGEVGGQIFSRPLLSRDLDSCRGFGMGPGNLCIFKFLSLATNQMILIHSQDQETPVSSFYLIYKEEI